MLKECSIPQLHEFFGDLYGEIFAAHDNIAEQIRAIHGYAPGSLSRYKDLTSIQDQVEIIDAREMVGMALADNEIVMDTIRAAYKAAEDAGEIGLSNFLQDRMDVHK